MAFWLLKSEPTAFSIDDFKRAKATQWDGVRNYQARNFLRAMQPGEKFLFYHSSSDTVGVAGLGVVKRLAYPDGLQFKRSDEHFEPRATREKPVWFAPDVEFLEKFQRIVTLAELRKVPALAKMVLLKRGSRLSVQPVSEKEFATIVAAASK